VIDISFKNRKGVTMDDDHKLLLRQVIRNNANFLSIEQCEGGNNLQGANGGCGAVTDHLHVNFRQ
jgi:hypothetical protein